MNDSKGNKQPQVIGIRQDIFKFLDDQYSHSRPKLPTFTAFVNGRLENMIKKEQLLSTLFPNLKILVAEPDTGIYVKDTEHNIVVEVEINKTNPFDSKCRYDKTKTCSHVQYALLSSELMDMFDDISDNSGETAYGADDAARKLLTKGNNS